jgi:VWFA-related protein
LPIVAIGVLVLSFTIGGASALSAQQQTLTVKINGFNAADWSRAQAVVTVLDDTGRPVSGLTQESFAAQLNDTPIAAVGLSRGIDSTIPLSVVLALDVNATMQGGALDQAKLAAHGFLDGLGPQDNVAVFAYGDTVNLVQPFTQDHAGAHVAIDGIAAAGGSALYQATVQSVLQASASADTGRRAVVLLSSGANTGEGSQEEALFAAQALGVPVFDIGLGESIDRDYLRELAQVSGGQFTETPAAEGLVQLYLDASELLRDQYVLTLDASGVTVVGSEPVTLGITAVAGDRSGSDERAICPERLCLRLHDIVPDEKLAEARTVSAEVLASDPVISVTFYVDGAEAVTDSEPPYEFTLDPTQYSGGGHTLAAEVTSAATSARSGDVPLRFPGTGGGSSTSLMVIGALVALGIVGFLFVALLFIRRRGGSQGPKPVAPTDKPRTGLLARPRIRLRLLEDQEAAPAPVAQGGGAPLGRLHVVGGPLADQMFPVGSMPASIGAGARCLIRLPQRLEDGSEVAQEFARIWVRDDRLMLHELRRLTATGPVGGRWEMLEDGDSFSIGPCSFRFELGTEERQERPAAPAPDVLRSGPGPAPADAGLPAQPRPDFLRVVPEEPEAAAPEPIPDILRAVHKEPDAPAPAPEPIPDIFKSRPSSGAAQDVEESGEESPPQAAAGP